MNPKRLKWLAAVVAAAFVVIAYWHLGNSGTPYTFGSSGTTASYTQAAPGAPMDCTIYQEEPARARCNAFNQYNGLSQRERWIVHNAQHALARYGLEHGEPPARNVDTASNLAKLLGVASDELPLVSRVVQGNFDWVITLKRGEQPVNTVARNP
jgi:hypothetical protein